ncbi:MAG: hypothetical protein GXP27_19150 [Planctomycetes bacterium]|nr:hypothetical protein [Planctomycetota bacterium]
MSAAIHSRAEGSEPTGDPKPYPNHRLYLQILRRMTPEERLRKAFELSDFARSLFLQGLRRRFPDASEEQIRRIYLDRLSRCHNRNY